MNLTLPGLNDVWKESGIPAPEISKNLTFAFFFVFVTASINRVVNSQDMVPQNCDKQAH